MRSRVDLQNRVVSLLGEAFPGEIATSDDLATINGYIDGKVAELSRRRVMHIPDANCIDDEVFGPLARLVAVEAAIGQYHAAPADFRFPASEQTKRIAEGVLREMQIEADPGETVRADYF